jgi:hypothetical protein
VFDFLANATLVDAREGSNLGCAERCCGHYYSLYRVQYGAAGWRAQWERENQTASRRKTPYF